MKVLLIDVNYRQGSTGKIVYDLYNELNNGGHMSSACYGRGPKYCDRDVFKFGINIETYFHAFLSRMTGVTGCFSFFSTRRFLKYFKKFSPDVVHIHELHGYFVNIVKVMKYLKKNNIKTIWTFHCEFMYSGKGYLPESGVYKKNEMKKIYPKSLFFERSRQMAKRYEKTFKGFDNLDIITPSNWLAEKVKKTFLRDKNIQVINNGIDTNLFKYNSNNGIKENLKLQNKKIILSVAPNIMCERKGGDLVLELAKRYSNEFTFILIGVKDENMNIERPDNVILIQSIYNQKELVNYYSAADVFLIPSRQENFPTTCIEALCCGLPVVGFDVGGSKETIPDGCGAFVDPFDLDKLHIALNKIINDQGINKEKIMKYAHARYSKDVFKEKMLEVYYRRGK